MSNINLKYHNLLKTIKEEGRMQPDPNRKGVYRLNIPKYEIVHNLQENFPAISTKELYWRGIVAELIWFLNGGTNILYLIENKCNIWNKDAYRHYQSIMRYLSKEPLSMEDFLKKVKLQESFTYEQVNETLTYTFGDLGPIYGAQWRGKSENSIDQLAFILEKMSISTLYSDLVVNAWNPSDGYYMSLQPCHMSFQILGHMLNDEELRWYNKSNLTSSDGSSNQKTYGFDLVWSQRSVDTFLGLPFNIASYSLLAKILGVMTNTVPRNIYGDLRNVHLYSNSLEGVDEQLKRSPLGINDPEVILPEKKLRKIMDDYFNGLPLDFSSLEVDDFKLVNYKSMSPIRVEMLTYNK